MGYQSYNRNIQAVLYHLDEQLEKLATSCAKVYSSISTAKDVEEAVDAANILTSEVLSFHQYWKNYTSTYREAVDIDIAKVKAEAKEEVEKAKKELAESKELLERYKGSLKMLVIDNNKLTEENRKLQQADNKEVVDRCMKLLDMVEINAKALSLQRKLKESRGHSGVESPKWRQDVDNTQLAEDYKQAGCKITKSLCEKYKMTQPALRKRLIDIGEYKGRQSK